MNDESARVVAIVLTCGLVGIVVVTILVYIYALKNMP